MAANMITNDALGRDISGTNKVLDNSAALTQNFAPVNQICAHLNAFHVYAADPGRCVEANHYCSHLNEDVRQCLIYDSPEKNARLIGVEYMISAAQYKTLDEAERKLWHSHVFEVKSGMLIMPTPPMLPNDIRDIPETKEMEQVVGLYGKTYHFWQIDRGDKLPLGEAQLMMSFTRPEQTEKIGDLIKDRDQRFKVDSEEKKAKRQYIEEPEIHEDADSVWKSNKTEDDKSERAGLDAGNASVLAGH